MARSKTPKPKGVLDASAVLAYLNQEPGSEAVEAVLYNSAISTVNASEVFAKLTALGVDVNAVSVRLEALGLKLLPFTADDARAAAAFYPETRSLGLSLGDRACLALGLRLKVPVWTADAAWQRLHTQPAVRLIR